MFTAEIGTWWDDDKHILEAPLAEMVFEPFVGGHIIDRGVDGSECRWARVLAYEPPHRVVFSWDINTRWQIETDPNRTSEVEIAFTEFTPDTHACHAHPSPSRPARRGLGRHARRRAGGWCLTPLAERIARADRVTGRVLPAINDDTMRARLAASASYTAILLHATDAFVRPAVDPIIWEHGRRNMALVEAGLLSVVLPVADDTPLAGIGVFAATPTQTRTIMDDDPGIRAGIFTYEVHPVRGFPGAHLP